MFLRHFVWLSIGAALTLCLSAQPQLPRLSPTPLNLDFLQGEVGHVPPNWELPAVLRRSGFSAELRRQGCRSSIGCIVLIPPDNSKQAGIFSQTFDATAYRGAPFQVTAW